MSSKFVSLYSLRFSKYLLAAVFLTLSTLQLEAQTPPSFEDEWGSLGSDDDQFNSPTGVAVDSFGNVYVVDSEVDGVVWTILTWD